MRQIFVAALMIGLGLLATATVSSLLQQWAIRAHASKVVEEEPEAAEKPLGPTSGPGARPNRAPPAPPARNPVRPQAAEPPSPPLVNQGSDEHEFRLGSPYKVGKQAPTAKPALRPAPAPSGPAIAPASPAPPMAPPAAPSFNPTFRPASGTERRA